MGLLCCSCFVSINPGESFTNITPRTHLYTFNLLISLNATSAAVNYDIATTWNNQTIDHLPVRITLDKNDAASFKILISAPFYNDPAEPPGPPNEPFYGLWEYEGCIIASLLLRNDTIESLL